MGERAATAAILAVALLAPGELWAQGPELVLWHGYRAGEQRALDATVQSFRDEHAGLRVRVLAVPAAALSQKLRNAIPTGHGPDLFIMAHDELGDLRRRGLVEPVPGEGKERFIPETLVPLTVEGRLWGLPLAFKSLALFYRTDLVDEPPTTTDALIADAARLTAGQRYGLAYLVSEPYFHAPWLFGHGAHLLSADGTRATLADGPAVQAGTFLRRLVEATGMPADANGALVTELFNRGRVAMVINGPWFISEIAEGVPFAVAPLPVVSQTGLFARPFVTVDAVFVARARSNPMVLELARHLTSDASALRRARIGRQPVANAAVYDAPSLVKDRLLPSFRRQLAHSEPLPTEPLVHLIWDPMREALRQIARGALSPKAALRRAQARVEKLDAGLPPPARHLPYTIVVVCIVAVLLGGLVWRLRRGLGRELREGSGAYAMVAPAAVGMALLVGIPLIMGLGVGFFAFGPDEIRFVGLANFVSILDPGEQGVMDPTGFWFTLAVTVGWTVLNVLLHLAIGLGLALMLNEASVWGRDVFRVLLILPWAVPSYITALIFKGLFNKQLGAVNAVIVELGGTPVGWFDSFLPAFAANLTANVWLGFPFMMVTLLGALQTIPADLYDAARVDGAGAWRRLVSITLPMVAPALVPAVVLGSIWTFNMFNVVFLVSEGQPEGASDILVTEAYRWAFTRNGRYGYAAAYSLLIFLILLLYSRWTTRLTARGRHG